MVIVTRGTDLGWSGNDPITEIGRSSRLGGERSTIAVAPSPSPTANGGYRPDCDRRYDFDKGLRIRREVLGDDSSTRTCLGQMLW